MRKTQTIAVLLALAYGLAGCGAFTSPAGPSAAPSTALDFAVFVDRESGMSTVDVRDVHEQIVRFNTAGELVWTATGARFPGFLADGAVVTAGKVCPECYFLVRFGTRDGERHPYLTWSGDPAPGRPVTILDVDVVGGQLVVLDTDVPLR